MALIIDSMTTRYISCRYTNCCRGMVHNGFSGIKVSYKIDADAKKDEIEALVAQSQKRSAVYDIVTNPTNVTVVVN